MARRIVTEEPPIYTDRADVRQERVVTTDDGPVVDRDAMLVKNIRLNKWQRLIYTIAGIINGLLAIRFVFSLLGANPENGLANLIYTITNPLVEPFRGLFSVTDQLGTARFEIETLIAILFYSLIAYALARLIGIGKDTTDVNAR